MNKYAFTFHAHDDLSATLSYFPEPRPGRRPTSRLFKERDLINFVLTPVNASDPITQLVIHFTNNGGTGGTSPFSRDANPLSWKTGDGPVTIGNAKGDWGFSATLTSLSGKVYQLPDPELEVGD